MVEMYVLHFDNLLTQITGQGREVLEGEWMRNLEGLSGFSNKPQRSYAGVIAC